MDYRYRKYFIVRLYYYNENLKELQETVPSLEVHTPYNHFTRKNNKYNHKYEYDGVALKKLVHVLLTCRNEDVEKLENKINEMKQRYNNDYIFIMPYNKELLGQ